MTPAELASFVGLAVVTNTLFPMPFEPVLVAYAAARPGQLWLLSIAGSLSAGGAALLDATLFRGMRYRLDRRRARTRPRARFPYYAGVFGCALLPLPFAIVRLSLLRSRPRLLSYAGAVAAGRLPRYVALVWFGEQLQPPDTTIAGVALSVVATTIAWRHMRRPRHDASAGAESGE